MGGKAEKNTYLGKIVTEAVVRYTASVFLWRRRSRSGRGGGYFAASVQILFSKQTPTADAFSLSRPREGRLLPSERDANGGIFENGSEVWDRLWGIVN